MSVHSVKRGVWRRWKKVFIVGYGVLGIAGLYNYIDWKSAAFVLGVLALLFTPAAAGAVAGGGSGRASATGGPLEGKSAGGWRYGGAALALAILYIFLPVKTVLYLLLVCAVCFFRESFYRRVAPSILIVLLLMAPVTEYFVQIFGFPIRLWLTDIAGKLIGLMGQPVSVAGNILSWQGTSFSVDPACMGLHMMVASLLAAVLLMNYYHAHYRRRLSPGRVILLLGLVVGMNIVANLFRIVCLVLLTVLPDNPLHGLLGLLILVVYVLLPMAWLIRRQVSRRGRPVEKATEPPPFRRSRWMLAGNWLVGASAFFVVIQNIVKDHQPMVAYPEKESVAGYTIKKIPGPILQLDNGRSLVYIKPIPDFYYTEHSPLLCWQGSGYHFSQLRECRLQGVDCYEGLLQKDSEVLYTAWWYDNGIRQTARTLDWRWDVLRGGQPYSIVNITAASPRLLEAEVGRVLETRPFQKWLLRSERR